MRTDFVKQSAPAAVLSVVLIAGLFCLRLMLPGTTDGGLHWSGQGHALPGTFVDAFASSGIYTYAACALFLTFFNGWLLCRFSVKNMLVDSNTLLPLVLYCFFTIGLWSGEPPTISSLIAAVFLAASFFLMASSFVRSASPASCFAAGFLLGFAPMFEPAAAGCLLMIPVGLAMLKRSGREIVTGIIGMLLPFAASCYLAWLMHGDAMTPVQAVCDNIELHRFGYGTFVLTDGKPVFMIFTALIFFISLIAFLSLKNGMRTRTYKVSMVVICCFAVTIATALVLDGAWSRMIPIISVSASLAAVNIFRRWTGKFAAFLYTGMLLLCCAAVLYHFLP